MAEFGKVAPYLSDPLVLVGFFLFVFFGFCRLLLKKGIIPPLGRTQGYRVLRLILLYGFLLGVAIIGLGFGLKYRSLSEAEQTKATGLVKAEVEANSAVANQLVANLEQLIEAHEAVTHALRDVRFPILAISFPEANLKKGLADPTPHDLVESALLKLRTTGLDKDRQALLQTDRIGLVIVATIDRTLPTMRSLADMPRARYVFRRTAYEANSSVLRRVEKLDLRDLPLLYADLEKVRANYEVVVGNLISYLEAVRDLFKSEDLNETSLTRVLTAERLATSLLLSYTPELIAAAKNLKNESNVFGSAN